jgi:hypothetical protein
MIQSKQQLIAIRDSVALVGRLSDSLIKLGPFSLGLDGLIAWVPGLGEIYSTLAGAFIVLQGARAGVPGTVLVSAIALLGLRTLATTIPLAGAAFADLFTAHKWAAAMIVRAIDQKIGLTEAGGNAPEFGRWRPGQASA